MANIMVCEKVANGGMDGAQKENGGDGVALD
jgi:hypothetical protein